jgi:hypothetical protein
MIFIASHFGNSDTPSTTDGSTKHNITLDFSVFLSVTLDSSVNRFVLSFGSLSVSGHFRYLKKKPGVTAL